MRTVAIIQARMGSSRLPGKVLADLNGRPLLERVIRRTQRAETLDDVVLATSDLAQDDVVADLGRVLGVPVFRGSERDVLSRYVGAAKQANADICVRVTADCPLVDPGVIDRTVRSLRMSKYDFATNSVLRSFPRGLDVEAMWSDVLYRVDRMAESPASREHVCWYMYMERPDLFLIRHIKDDRDRSSMNWCVDTQLDLEYVRRIYDDVDYRALIERIEEAA